MMCSSSVHVPQATSISLSATEKNYWAPGHCTGPCLEFSCVVKQVNNRNLEGWAPKLTWFGARKIPPKINLRAQPWFRVVNKD